MFSVGLVSQWRVESQLILTNIVIKHEHVRMRRKRVLFFPPLHFKYSSRALLLTSLYITNYLLSKSLHSGMHISCIIVVL